MSASYAIGRDIDATPASTWHSGHGFTPIGISYSDSFSTFSGVLDGFGHTVDNLFIDSTEADVGLIAQLDTHGTVRNIGLTNASITATTTPTNTEDTVGVLVGYNTGSIDNAFATGTVTEHAAAGISNDGGLVGVNSGTVSRSYAAVSVSAGSDNIGGGLVGNNLGTITGSHATGSVNATVVGGLTGNNTNQIANSYATGTVTGIAASGLTTDAGGLVGDNAGNNTATITASYATGNVSGGDQAYVGGLVGVTYDGGAITQSFATGNVSAGKNAAAGGLVGVAMTVGSPTTISQTYATGAVSGDTGSVVGGLIGSDAVSFDQSYATGAVGGNASSNFEGGLVGGVGGSSVVATHSYWDTQATGQPLRSGITGADPGTAGLTTAQLKASLPAGLDPTVWASTTNVNGGYPSFTWQTAASPPLSANPVIVNFGTDTAPPPPPPPPPPAFSATPLPSGGLEIDISQSAPQAAALINVATICATDCAAASLHDSLNTALTGIASLSPTYLVVGNFQVSESVQSGILKVLIQAINTPPPAPAIDPTPVAQTQRVVTPPPPSGPLPTPAAPPLSGIGSTPTGNATISIDGISVSIQIQKESTKSLDDPYSYDCLATVYAMLGSSIETERTGTQKTYSAAIYTQPYGGYFATTRPSDGGAPNSGAPSISVGTTLPLMVGSSSPNVLFGLPNPAVFSNNPVSNLTSSSLPAIIGGTIVGKSTGKILPHFMLAIAIDPSTKEIIALDPLTGLEVRLNSQGIVVSPQSANGSQHFQASGFVTAGG